MKAPPVAAPPARAPVPSQSNASRATVQLSPDGNQSRQREIREAAGRGVAGTGDALPHRDRIQRSFGHHDVGGIRAHVGAAALEASRAIGANAYATGNDVAFAGEPDLRTTAHEAAHVVQQRSGVQLLGGIGAAGDRYEQHAERVADLVVQGKSSESVLDEHAGGGGGGIQRTCATCPPGEPCGCDVQRDEVKYGVIPTVAEGAAPEKPDAFTKTFANGWTFSSDRAFTRGQLTEMWKKEGRAAVKAFVDSCDSDDPEVKAVNDRTDFNWKGWDGNGTPPPAPAMTPVYDKPPPTPADLEKSGAMPRVKLYDAIRWEFRGLDARRAAFEGEFQKQAKVRLELIIEASRKQINGERARYGLDDDGKKTGKSNSAETQKDLAEMAEHAKRLAMLKRQLNLIYASERDNAMPADGLFSLKWGSGSGALYPTMNGANGIGRRLEAQQAYDEERAFAFGRWPVLAGNEPKGLEGSPAAWTKLATGATATKAGPEQLAMIDSDTTDKLKNLDTVTAHIGDGELIWDLPNIVWGTERVLGFDKDALEHTWIDEHSHKLALDKATQQTIMTAITLSLVVITLIPSGGSSTLALVGGAASLGLAGISSYQAVNEIREYALASAESNTTYDRALAISSEEPSLFRVALAIAGATLDIWGASHAFKRIATIYRSAIMKEAGAVERLLEAGDKIKPGLGRELVQQASRGGEIASKVFQPVEALERLGQKGVEVLGHHEGVFSKLGKLFRCSPVCGEARHIYEAILSRRPDLLRELNRIEEGVLDAATALERQPAAKSLLNELERLRAVTELPDETLKLALQATKRARNPYLVEEAVRRFGSVERALGPELIGKAAEAPTMLKVDPKAWMAPENFKAFDAVNVDGAKVATEIVEETIKGKAAYVVEQHVKGGKWYSIKTLNAPVATKGLVEQNVKQALDKAFDEAFFKAATARDPTPIAGKDIFLRVIKDGPADSIEIVINIPVKNSANPTEIKAAQEWADAVLKEWEKGTASLGKLPPTKVTVMNKGAL